MDFNKYFNDLPLDLNVKDHDFELQFLKLYVFNAFFNADEIKTDEVNDGTTYNRKNGLGVDGVFINPTLEDTAIELLYVYHVGDGKFSILSAMNALVYMQSLLSDVIKGLYLSGNSKAENLISNYLNDSDTKNVVLRVITDYIPDDDEKYKLNKLINEYNVSVKGLKVESRITYGDDVINEVESNVAPYDYVSFDKLILDKPNNFLTYDDNSFVCNISAKSLKELWRKEGKRGLLAMNLRYYIKSKNIDSKIEESITYTNKDFWYLNNGIIIVCNDYKMVGNELRMTEFSIVNGGQTSRMIGEIPFEDDFYICCKVIKNTFEDATKKNMFISKIAEATNTQKPIKSKDIIANKVEQRNLKSALQEVGVFIEIKRGEKFNHDIYKEAWQRTKNNELAQDIYSFVYMEPGPSRNNVSTILSNNDKYERIFASHTYDVNFLKDLVVLEKCYREYSKAVSKNDDENPTKKGLVKNGLFYCLATVGYVLKMAYNKEYKNSIIKYRNNDSMYELFSTELAFNHRFIDSNIDYKLFKAKSYDLFDFIFNNYIKIEFDLAKESNQSLAYSNWTKTNTGFNSIRRRINSEIFDYKDERAISFIKKFFRNATDDELNSNIDNYVDYTKIFAKKAEGKTSDGMTMDANDTQLRNDLMEYRLKYSLDRHVSENKVFTDKQLEKIVMQKPLTKKDLSKCVSDITSYYCGDDILKIVAKHI